MLFPQFSYDILVWGLYAGVTIGAVATTVSRFTTGNTVRTLIAEGASSPESAKTADELGLTGLSRRALRGSLYGKLFFCANADEARKPARKKRREYEKPRLDMSAARFYLPKDKQEQARERFPRPNVAALIIGVILLTGLFTLLHFFLPTIVSSVVTAFTF